MFGLGLQQSKHNTIVTNYLPNNKSSILQICKDSHSDRDSYIIIEKLRVINIAKCDNNLQTYLCLQLFGNIDQNILYHDNTKIPK